MASFIDRAIEALFPLEGNRVGNVKFFLGHGREVSGEQLAEQLLRADAQVAAGESHFVIDIDGDLSV